MGRIWSPVYQLPQQPRAAEDAADRTAWGRWRRTHGHSGLQVRARRSLEPVDGGGRFRWDYEFRNCLGQDVRFRYTVRAAEEVPAVEGIARLAPLESVRGQGLLPTAGPIWVETRLATE